jgi:membrane-bound lytic murein transglycosylase MltF
MTLKVLFEAAQDMRKLGLVLVALGKALALVTTLVVGTCEAALAQLAFDDGAEIPLTDAERAEDVLIAAMLSPWTGDLDGMVKRGFVRMGVAQEPVAFVYDGMRQRGISVEYAREFEKHLRQSLGPSAQTLTVALVPLSRDQMFDALVSGGVDFLAANLTITAARSARAAFANPTLRGVRELVVTGPAAPRVSTLDNLADVGVYVRRSSSYYEHLVALNAKRTKEGKGAIRIVEADDRLEDYDLVELANVGVIPAVILDSHKAELYSQIFKNLKVHDELAVNEGGEIAWAVRKDSPKLLGEINAFVEKARKGTELGNTLYRRWYADPTQVLNAIAPGEDARFVETIGFISRHAAKYDFDPMLIAAQGYQESRLDQSKRSPAGAIGIMQLMPATASDPNVGIPEIEVAERNIEAGVKYLRHLRSEYFGDPAISPFDQTCFAFAAYNAGPGNIRKARARAATMGLDANVWFGNVEVAAGRTISREPVVYVRNILKYYTSYRIFQARANSDQRTDRR